MSQFQNLVKVTNGLNMPNVSAFDGFLNMKEAANHIHVSMSTMEKYSAKRMFPKYRPNNGKVYFKKSDLDLFMESCRMSSTAELTNEVNSCLQMMGQNRINNPLKQAS